jgi:hypothetical protein
MTSQLVERLGVQVPQIQHLPPDVHSLDAATEAIELANAYGVCSGGPLSEAQQFTLRAALGERRDGTWAAATVADFKGRQGGGKSDTIAARELAGLVLFDEQLIIHTAHEFPTANESFLRLVAVFEAWDDLRKRVSRIRYANGEQGIEFLSGQRLKYRARTGGSGRGFAKADLVVYDEAQHLMQEHIAASGPARLASKNSQSWYAGSGGFTTSKQAWRLRRRALSGAGGRLAYTENTAEVVSLVDGRVVSVAPDPFDHDAWAQANPGLNRWVSEEALADLFQELGPELFARECLCVWESEPGEGDSVVDAATWNDLADADSKIESHRMWSLSVAPDRKWSSFGIAGRTADGLLHVETLKDGRRKGTSWVLEFAADAYSRRRIPLRIHKSGPEGSFIAPLRERGVEVVEVSSADVAQATGQFIDAANGGALRHLGQGSLDVALRGAVLRQGTDGAVLWSQRNSQVEITALMACTVAAGGVPADGAKPFWFI